ncbi:hypothetical protein ABH931_007455 [Streptacidiphilus sp. MAP12-33]
MRAQFADIVNRAEREHLSYREWMIPDHGHSRSFGIGRRQSPTRT